MTTDSCLGDDQLYAVTDGEVESQMQAHLDACSICSNKLRQLETRVATFRQLYNRRQDRPDEAPATTTAYERLTFLGKYFIAGVHSEDEQVVVYRGVHSVLKAEVFIYRSKTVIGSDEKRMALLAECRRIGAVQPPSTARILDVEFFEETPCLVVEYVEGRTLDNYISSPQLKPIDSAALILGVANALAESHRHGVVHGMLSGSSIVVDENGQPHLIDFGVSCLRGLADDASATKKLQKDDVRALAHMLQSSLAAASDERRVRRILQVVERATASVEEGGIGDAGEFAQAISQALHPPMRRIVVLTFGLILIAICAWAFAAFAS